ncbi:MAG: hypothetical protein PVG87_11480, partial [Desulfobacteraceae bacterium]
MPKTSSDKPSTVYGLGSGAEFDDRLLALEKSARYRYSKIIESLTLKKLPRWLDQMLDHSFLPTLRRIGFYEPFSKVLFKIAPSSWKLMGPLNEKILAFHPLINQQIEEVRQGLESKARKNNKMFPPSSGALPQTIPGTMKDNASPENLFDLLDEIATPWIILPRVFRFLKKEQCRYLPVYLKTIDSETRESSLKLFSRIAVEFMGNFSLKFADSHHPPDQLMKLLFYGYSALFWKTLRCPPENLENSAAFDHFFTWLYRLIRKSDFLGSEEATSINRMIMMKTMAFPAGNFSRPQIRSKPDISRFIVTLRHGCIGIATILKYFGIDQFLETRQIGDRFACPSVQNEVHGLLHIIQTKYHLETKQTREYIKLFIGHLRSAYALMQTDFHQAEKNFLNRIFNDLQI